MIRSLSNRIFQLWSRAATEAYIIATDDLARECDAVGEVDYDGLMRQAVQVHPSRFRSWISDTFKTLLKLHIDFKRNFDLHLM